MIALLANSETEATRRRGIPIPAKSLDDNMELCSDVVELSNDVLELAESQPDDMQYRDSAEDENCPAICPAWRNHKDIAFVRFCGWLLEQLDVNATVVPERLFFLTQIEQLLGNSVQCGRSQH